MKEYLLHKHPAGSRAIRQAGKPAATTERRSEWGFLLVFLLLSAGIIATGCFYYQNYQRSYRTGVEQQLSTIADLKVNELAQYRKERWWDAATLFNNAAFSGLVRRFLDHPEDTEAPRQIQEWAAKYLATEQYDLICLFDAQGVIRMSMPAGRPPISSVVSQRIPEVLKSGRVTFQDFTRNEHDQLVYLTLLAPIFDGPDHSQVLGVLAMRINPETYLYPLLRRWPALGLTGETLLVRREGSEVVFLNELRFQTNTALNLHMPLDRISSPAAQAALGREGVMEGIDYRGVPVAAALRNIPDSPWALEARMDVAEVYGPLRKQLWLVILLIGALLLGAGATVGLVWRHQSVRFYREKAAAADTLWEAREALRRLNAELEQRVVERTAQLQVTHQELEAFSYSVSHDLRAPLRHVMGFVDLLQKDLPREIAERVATGVAAALISRGSPGEIRPPQRGQSGPEVISPGGGPALSEKSLQHLATISQSAKRMGDLIDDLLDFSRVGRAVLQKTEIHLDELVRETLGDFKAETKGRNIAWNIHPLPPVQADRALLRMALVNLISNAVKFTGARAEAKIEIGCAPNGNGQTEIFIRDNGVGFDPQYTGKLFGVFQRLHSQDEFEGTGIGLANVQRIIHRHGGRAWAEGAVDGGATFYFSIPKQHIEV
jgi:signal transduction histidine kinase